jgi:hypothetical protein
MLLRQVQHLLDDPRIPGFQISTKLGQAAG